MKESKRYSSSRLKWPVAGKSLTGVARFYKFVGTDYGSFIGIAVILPGAGRVNNRGMKRSFFKNL
jgi:hypothetical protein